MSIVLVTGGTGSVGSAVVSFLLSEWHTVRVFSHQSEPAIPRGVEVFHGDLQTGAGLQEAVAGVDAIIHCASNYKQEQHTIDIQGTRRLVQAAQEQHSPYLIYISIVGIDNSPFAYYQAKRKAEEIIEQSQLPWTILRATQFHELILGFIKTFTINDDAEIIVPQGMRFQSIDHTEVAQRLVSFVQRGPSGHVPDMGGPQILTIEEMTTTYLRMRGKQLRIKLEPVQTDLYNAFRTGRNLVPDHRDGKVTWEEYLRASYES